MTTDSTMPRRDDDSDNWGGARPGAGKPPKDPDERKQTLGISVPGALKKRYDDLGKAQRQVVAARLLAELARVLAEVEAAQQE